MKKTVGAVLLLLLFHRPASASAPLVPEQFRFSSTIEGPITSGGLYRLSLPAGILSKCAAGCGDLRVFDPDGREVPYVLLDERWKEGQGRSYPLKIVGYESGPSASVVVMEMPEEHGPVDRLEISTRNRDFKKSVTVEGSDDQKRWAALGQDAIYDFSSQVDLRKTEVRFLESSYRYYRLRLGNEHKAAGPEESLRLRFNGLDLSLNRPGQARMRIDSAEARTAPAKERKGVLDEALFPAISRTVDRDGNTVIIIEAGLPFDRIVLRTSTPFFYRTVRLYASDKGDDGSFYYLGGGPIFRFPLSGKKEEREFIDCGAVSHRFYKIVIENRGNPAIDVSAIGLSWLRKNLFFIGSSDGEGYRLSVGNPAVKKTDYDLGHFVTKENWADRAFEERGLSMLRANGLYSPGLPADRREKIEKNLLTAVVLLLVAGIAYWLYALLRKAGAGGGQGGEQ